MKTTESIGVIGRDAMTKGEVKRLRKDGMVPASISIRGQDAVSISVRKDELLKILRRNGMNSVVQLEVNGQTSYTAMVREIQHAPLSREWLHITFQYVSMTEETTAAVPITVHGREAVSHAGLESSIQLDAVEVRGLPGDLPQTIEVDVSHMVAGDNMHARDLKLPEGITLVTEEDRLVFSVSHPRVQTEGEAAEAAAQEPALVGEQEKEEDA